MAALVHASLINSPYTQSIFFSTSLNIVSHTHINMCLCMCVLTHTHTSMEHLNLVSPNKWKRKRIHNMRLPRFNITHSLVEQIMNTRIFGPPHYRNVFIICVSVVCTQELNDLQKSHYLHIVTNVFLNNLIRSLESSI